MNKMLLIGLGLAAMAGHVLASENETLRYPLDKRYVSECGSCHVAYPARLLDAGSWRRLMLGLDLHFGSDASLDEPTRRDIQSDLERGAARSARGGFSARDGRISSTSWFRHEHDEVPPGAWRHEKIKSAANCAACHTGAEAGDYSERTLRMPSGIRILED
jgi:Dihaem cytochrome c